MHSLIFQRASKCIAHRYIILVIFVCSAFSAFAQHDISQRIYDVLISKNTRDCKVLMQQINETDIINFPDSTLLNYYYLAGWYSYENNNHKKQIEYSRQEILSEVKKRYPIQFSQMFSEFAKDNSMFKNSDDPEK